MATRSEHVVLRGCHVASLDALRLGWALESKGFHLEPVGDKLRVTPHTQLTAEEVAAIRVHRDELLALVKYDAEAVQ